jgi:D-alanyl-D-alanine carboxypeptidase/D-alanyl-D-alanine-endopeptidase (penicillin-binding protein 4)
MVASPDGRILYKKNETRKYVPASTLKLLTALAAIHHLGKSYRFPTEFYLDHEQNLKVKGYGDPLLISEVWQEIVESLSPGLPKFGDLVVDDTYFARDISIPGIGTSTNPYDATNGALCANFNTVFFKRDEAGRIVSAEPQTPMTPLALKKVRRLGLKAGRYNFSHNNHEAALYAGELFAHFLRERGSMFHGRIRSGHAVPNDKLLYTYRSSFTLEEGLKKMLEFSNNFMANQIFIALGAHVHGPPGNLDKGVQVVSHYAKEVLGLKGIAIAEGSGISRKNRLSALDFLAVLKAFEPHRALLTRGDNVLYKSGTLKGVRTRAGFIEGRSARRYYFVIFLNSPQVNIDALTVNLAKELDNCPSGLVPPAD